MKRDQWCLLFSTNQRLMCGDYVKERKWKKAKRPDNQKVLISVWSHLLLSQCLGSQEMSCHVYTFRVYTDIKGAKVRYKSTKPIKHTVSADAFKFVRMCVCVWFMDWLCSAKEVAAIHFLFGWKSHLRDELPRVLPHTITHKVKDNYMEEQTHTHPAQTTTQSISVCIVTWAYSKYKLFVLHPVLLRGLFLFVSVCECVHVCDCSFHRPTTTVLLINAILTLWYQVKGLWVSIMHT